MLSACQYLSVCVHEQGVRLKSWFMLSFHIKCHFLSLWPRKSPRQSTACAAFSTQNSLFIINTLKAYGVFRITSFAMGFPGFSSCPKVSSILRSTCTPLWDSRALKYKTLQSKIIARNFYACSSSDVITTAR